MCLYNFINACSFMIVVKNIDNFQESRYIYFNLYYVIFLHQGRIHLIIYAFIYITEVVTL